MHRTSILLGIALTLGAFPLHSVGQTPTSAQTPTAAAAQNSSTNSATTEKTVDEKTADTDKSSDKSAEKPDRKWHLRLGTISVGAGYARFGSPFYYPYGAYPYDGFYQTAYWDPYWSSPLYYPSGYFSYNDGRGEVKITLEPKTLEPKLAEVFVDNAYAGTADQLKTMWLQPGAYDLSVSSKDHGTYKRRIYVLSGRALKIAAKLELPSTADATETKP